MTTWLPRPNKLDLDAGTTRRLAFLFTFFLLGFEALVVGVNYSSFFAQLLEGDGLSIFSALTCIVLSLCLIYTFTHAALSASRAYRVVYFLIFTSAFAVEYTFQRALGRFSDVFDITLAIATTPEQKLASIGMYFGTAALVPCLVFLFLLAFTRSRRSTGMRALIVVNILVIGLSAAAWTLSMPRFPSISAYAFYRTGVEYVLSGHLARGRWAAKITGAEIRRNPVEQVELQPSNNIVFVVDESVRGDHLSLNGYPRETTPFLSHLQQEGVLHNWGIASAASTNSHFSYTALIAGLTPDDFPDASGTKANTTPIVFQYAKAAGYTTWFFDGQMDDLWGGVDDDRAFIDHWYGASELSATARSETDIDIEIAKRVNGIVGGSRGNFVFVFKRGMHAPYHTNFPAEQAVWQPSYAPFHRFDIPDPDRAEEIVNAYDNAIRYNIDAFFENLVSDYGRIPNDTVIVYTSDHGQTLAAGGKGSHGGDSVPEATVPLLILGNLAAKPDTGYRASHSNLVPTLIDLMGYPREKVRSGISLSLLKATAADSRQRFFNPQLGSRVPFD